MQTADMKEFCNRYPPLRTYLFLLLVLACLAGYISSPLALLCGFALNELAGHPFARVNQTLSGWLLKTAVVLLGFGMNFTAMRKAGSEGLTFTIVSITITLLLGLVLGRRLHISKRTAHLVASGTAICGGSAIAAIAPLVKASEKEVSVSMATVFLLNAVALFVFPPLGHWLHLNQQQFGLWSAIAIHDTSSVVGAAAQYGSQALQTATMVKLARALWIIPVSFLTAFLFRNREERIRLPWFILFYLAAIAINSLVPAMKTYDPFILIAAKRLLTLSLLLIGASLSTGQVKAIGYKPLLLGIVLWVVIATGSAVVIRVYT
jgi:uncharacterized integral membrane protein (TIGR00698 family)